jgi:dihydrofolate reductase
MTRTQYYAASSLDGFIADADDSLDWLFAARSEEGGPPGYGEFIASVGAMAMGSTTYEWILAHTAAGQEQEAVGWSYDLPCWVFTHRELPVPKGAQVVLTNDDVTTVHRAMAAAAGDRNIWIVGGGDLAGQFADAGHLDELLLAIAPVTLGAGAPLLPRRLDLKLEGVSQNLDFACLHYSVR